MLENLIDKDSMIFMVVHGSLTGQVVLLILVIMSSFSWAVIYLKWVQFHKFGQENEEFLRIFNQEEKLEQVYSLSQQFRNSSLARIFFIVFRDSIHVFKTRALSNDDSKYSEMEKLQILMGRLNRSIDRSINLQVSMMEKNLNILLSGRKFSPQ